VAHHTSWFMVQIFQLYGVLTGQCMYVSGGSRGFKRGRLIERRGGQTVAYATKHGHGRACVYRPPVWKPQRLSKSATDATADPSTKYRLKLDLINHSLGLSRLFVCLFVCCLTSHIALYLGY